MAGGVLLANAFFLIWFVTRKFTGMLLLGFGDVRLAAVLGLLLGWYGCSTCSTAPSPATSWPCCSRSPCASTQRKLLVRYSFGPPLIAGTLAVVLFHA